MSRRFRAAGGAVVHAPAQTMPFYASHPARSYVLALQPAPAPPARRRDVPLPPAGRPCLDVPACPEPSGPPWPWTRQHPAIEIDSSDAVLESAEELLAVIADRDLDQVFVAGVHTNMCIVQRPFGIATMVDAGVPCALLGDLTEAMPPGLTAAALDHVARHYCPVIPSAAIL